MQRRPNCNNYCSKTKGAAVFFEGLAFTHKREYVEWIISAKKDDTRQIRLKTTIEKLTHDKKDLHEK